jgi:UTP pyrophosphatase
VQADLPYLRGYAPELLARVHELIAANGLARYIEKRHPEAHTLRTDGALYDYANALKSRYLRNAQPLAKVAYDNRLQTRGNALGTLTAVSRVQGNKLKAKREIRIASTFKNAPAALLRMIVVHEVAHLKEREHDKAFYALCVHMEPDYHQLEWDTRLWLTALELPQGAGPSPLSERAQDP